MFAYRKPKNMKQVIFILIIPLFLALTGCKKDKLDKFGTSSSFNLTSVNTGTDYRITVFYPGEVFPTEKVPVVYVLDGFWWGNIAAETVKKLHEEGSIPPCLVVSLNYASGNGAFDRVKDLVYPGDVEGEAEADKFYRFMVNELVPAIELQYVCDTSKRVLFGHSLGGLFTMYSMLDNASNLTFNKLIAASASVGAGTNNYLFTKEAEVSALVNNIPATVFIGCGTYVGSATIMHQELYKRLKSRNYPGLVVDFATYPEQHGTDPYPIFRDGLKFVMNN